MQRAPLIPSENLLPLPTCPRTLHVIDTAVLLDVQVVTPPKNISALVEPGHNRLPMRRTPLMLAENVLPIATSPRTLHYNNTALLV